MELELFEANNGKCPYLENRRWFSYTFRAQRLEGDIYESLITHGFRRSGSFFYKNNCPGCNDCISIRILTEDFTLSRSQKRTWKKNQDITVVRQPAGFDEEAFALYRKYSEQRHETETSEKNYCDFLIHSAVETIMLRYYLESTLVGVGWLDVLPNSLSSVYFAFDPAYQKRRLGVFSVLKEIELAKKLHKPFLHMGFWVCDCKSMKYKDEYRPYELLVGGKWCSQEEVTRASSGTVGSIEGQG